jgi:uncharacterized Zn finger protein
VCQDCAGAIDSVVELLQGRLSQGVMTRICQEQTGLFPSPAEIAFTCTCPDWASMCKHVAAVLYGIGARLDEQPDLLFALRKVDQQDLISQAGNGPRKTGVADRGTEAGSRTAVICRKCSGSRWRPGPRPRSPAEAAGRAVSGAAS